MAGIKAQSTQNFVPIKEIRNGVVVLQDGSLRSILMASSVNMALKSEDEQASLLFQFQNFVNSLDFVVQFSIQSRNLDIRPYIATLEEKLTTQANDLMVIQTQEYIDFIKTFTKDVDIMSKSFFIIIPYTPAIIKSVSKSGVTDFFKKKEKQPTTTNTSIDEYITQLDQRVAVVEQGLQRTGVKVIRLGTEEMIELYYKIFNPGDLEKPISLKQTQ